MYYRCISHSIFALAESEPFIQMDSVFILISKLHKLDSFQSIFDDLVHTHVDELVLVNTHTGFTLYEALLDIIDILNISL